MIRAFFVKVFSYLFLAVFVIGCFFITQALFGNYFYNILHKRCQSFDYNDYPRWTWDWWAEQCSIIMQ